MNTINDPSVGSTILRWLLASHDYHLPPPFRWLAKTFHCTKLWTHPTPSSKSISSTSAKARNFVYQVIEFRPKANRQAQPANRGKNKRQKRPYIPLFSVSLCVPNITTNENVKRDRYANNQPSFQRRQMDKRYSWCPKRQVCSEHERKLKG